MTKQLDMFPETIAVSSLDELMSRDPLKLSAVDLDAIIAAQRANRERLHTVPKRKTKAKKGEDFDLDAPF